MKHNFYTHALWRVKPGKGAEFIDAWKRFGEALSRVPNTPALEGTLIQSTTDSLIYYSFGPWEKMESIQAMRQDDGVKIAMEAILALCQEASPGTYKTVMQLNFPTKAQ